MVANYCRLAKDCIRNFVIPRPKFFFLCFSTRFSQFQHSPIQNHSLLTSSLHFLFWNHGLNLKGNSLLLVFISILPCCCCLVLRLVVNFLQILTLPGALLSRPALCLCCWCYGPCEDFLDRSVQFGYPLVRHGWFLSPNGRPYHRNSWDPPSPRALECLDSKPKAVEEDYPFPDRNGIG